MWSTSYIERPEGTAPALHLRPSLKVAWNVKIGNRFFSRFFTSSNSSFVISPRFHISQASLMAAHTRATCGERAVSQKSPGVQSCTLRLFTLFDIPKLMIQFLLFKINDNLAG